MLRSSFAFWIAVSFTAIAVAQPDESASGPHSPENWAQWRGPMANGSSPDGTPPVSWSDTQNVRWKVPVPGKGSASPIVWEDRIFLLTAIPTDDSENSQTEEGPPSQRNQDPPQRRGRGRGRGPGGDDGVPSNPYQFTVLCYDRQSGEERWRKVVREEVPHEGGHPTNTFASGSPVTDGNRLFASFGSYGVYCLDLDGNVLWERDFGDMETRNGFGEGTSPALHENTLVVTWDHEAQSRIFAVNADSGETIWEHERDEPTTWATPLIVAGKDRTQVVTNGTNRVRSYDLKTGDLLWECGGQASNPIPSPVTIDDLVICMTGYRGFAVYAIPLDAKGDVTDTEEIAWRLTDTGPYVSSPVLYDGQLYLTKSRDAILYRVDALTGKKSIEQKRIPELGTLYSSPVAAGGHIYFTDREGTTTVIEHGPELKVVSVNHLPEVVDASPAIVGSQMFIRGSEHLYCMEAAASDATGE